MIINVDDVWEHKTTGTRKIVAKVYKEKYSTTSFIKYYDVVDKTYYCIVDTAFVAMFDKVA